MYIEPNTIIKVLHGCPLNNTYEHTLFFANATNQLSYFNTLVKYTLDRQSYQRVNNGIMRVAIKTEDLYDCNYLMFQNTSFGSKWFYAFIKSVNYVNNITSEIEFEIDVMQSWFFDYDIKPCFVEREHAVYDTIGGNTVPENLETGEYVSDGIDVTGLLGTALSVIVASTFKYNSETNELIPFHGGVYAGVYSGLYFNVFSLNIRPPGVSGYNGITELNEFLQVVSEKGKEDGIVSIFMMPTSMINLTDESSQNNGLMSVLNKYDISRTKNNTIGDYEVKNKKLLTYPYNFFYVTNLQGNSCAFHYELFSNPTHVTFKLTGDFSCNPGVVLYPTNYKGVSDNYDEKLTISGFPQCGYTIDSFRSWVAQHGVSMAVNGITAVGTSALAGYRFGGNYGALIAGGATALTRTASSLAQVYERSIMPRHSSGTGGSTTLASNGMLDFVFMCKHIRTEYAKIIDDYFSMYGYATNRVKTPNRASRPHWNYVKTNGANIIGNMPADDIKKIISIYDNGITFWKNGANLGNYNLDNSV